MCVGAGRIQEISVPSSLSCCEFKSALKIVFIKKKKKEKEGKEEGEGEVSRRAFRSTPDSTRLWG